MRLLLLIVRHAPFPLFDSSHFIHAPIYELASSNEVVNHLATLDEMAQHMNIMVPMQVLTDIDNSRNPMNVTRDRIERAATENQFMNGKIAAIEVSLDHLSLIPALLVSFYSRSRTTRISTRR